jgi:hypothetical protein
VRTNARTEQRERFAAHVRAILVERHRARIDLRASMLDLDVPREAASASGAPSRAAVLENGKRSQLLRMAASVER